MGKIFNLALLALVLYLAYAYGMPWIQQNLGNETAPETPGGRCVQLADSANDAFGARVSRVSAPGSDAVAWGEFVADVQTRIEAAQAACRCSEPSCRKAAQAMQDLANLLDQFDQRFRGSSRRWANPVEQQLHINTLINDAFGLAREGR